uniref:Transmembrane protein n=1 Tax=Lactuca sativa TaxID=4236 RepID=A0A9R1XNG9_LACSA|nr:hypothetical protein LSAT_V11C400215650 [Lactuca sativa]
MPTTLHKVNINLEAKSTTRERMKKGRMTNLISYRGIIKLHKSYLNCKRRSGWCDDWEFDIVDCCGVREVRERRVKHENRRERGRRSLTVVLWSDDSGCGGCRRRTGAAVAGVNWSWCYFVVTFFLVLLFKEKEWVGSRVYNWAWWVKE